MLRRIFFALFCLSGLSSAITVEVVNLHQPLSLHFTDGVGEEINGELLQAAVMSRPYAITGAIPEDLVKAVATPHQIPSNAEAYNLKDANLLNLCKIALNAEMRRGKLLVRFDVSKFSIPEEVDLAAQEVMQLSIMAVERTLRDYFKKVYEEEAFEVSIGVVGTNEGNASLRELAKRFKIGEAPGEKEKDK